jgi:hypothetical protein
MPKRYQPTHPTRFFVMVMYDDAVQDASLFWTKNQSEEQTSQIITRLDTLENEVKKIKEKLNLS